MGCAWIVCVVCVCAVVPHSSRLSCTVEPQLSKPQLSSAQESSKYIVARRVPLLIEVIVFEYSLHI